MPPGNDLFLDTTADSRDRNRSLNKVVNKRIILVLYIYQAYPKKKRKSRNESRTDLQSNRISDIALIRGLSKLLTAMQYLQRCKQPNQHRNLRKYRKQSKVARLLIATMQISINNGGTLYNTYSLQEILESVQENFQQQRSEQLKLWNPFQYQVKDE